MDAVTITDSLAGVGSFLGYFGAAVLLLVLFTLIYGRVTPYPEFRLIREGKVAPAVSFTGAVLGFVAPLASAISHSIALLDMIVWAVVALVIQIAVFLVLRLIFADLCGKIADDGLAAAILLGGASLAVGLLNAACMTY
jgi:putative membrane protein